VVNTHVYAAKILFTILLSNLIAFGFYRLRTRTASRERAALSRAA
jgi:Mn2+/Fe2+ NRAMP family transporter